MNKLTFVTLLTITSSLLHGHSFASDEQDKDEDFSEFMEKMDVEDERERLADHYRNQRESTQKEGGDVLIKAKNATRNNDKSLNLSGNVIVTTSKPLVVVHAGSFTERGDELILEGDVQIKINDKILSTSQATVTKNGNTIISADNATISSL